MKLWPTSLVGLAGAGLAAIAGHQRWAGPQYASTRVATDPALAAAPPAGDAPTVTAVALVVLAAWGVLLVTRGRFRIAAALVSALAAVGLMAATIDALATVRHTIASAYGLASVGVGFSSWPFVAVVGAVGALVASGIGVVRVRSWPEMGRRYDAPTGPAAPAVPLEEQSALDVWKAMDEGVDPTADRSE